MPSSKSVTMRESSRLLYERECSIHGYEDEEMKKESCTTSKEIDMEPTLSDNVGAN